MTGFTKLFSSIIGSTIWQESHATKIVWITLLALADRDGLANISLPGLAHFAGVTTEEAQAAIDKFQAPDAFSRSSEHEGRRIEPIDGGWLILNYDKYRQTRSPEDVRERGRIRTQRWREKKRHASRVSHNVTKRHGDKCDDKAEAEADIHSLDSTNSIATHTFFADEDYCAEPKAESASAPPPESPFVSIPLNDKSEFPVYEPEIAKWQELFPAIDVHQELRNCVAWNLSHPARRKTRGGINAHITSWLSKEQNRSRGNGRTGKDVIDQIRNHRTMPDFG